MNYQHMDLKFEYDLEYIYFSSAKKRYYGIIRENNKKVIVRVNDRGPFVDDRLIDLSYAAALKLDVVKNGTAKVKVKTVTEQNYSQNEVINSISFIQIGVFEERKNAYDYLTKARYDGRDLNKSQLDDNINTFGYHMYMTPEDAARGLILFNQLNTKHEDTHSSKSYKDITQNSIFS